MGWPTGSQRSVNGAASGAWRRAWKSTPDYARRGWVVAERAEERGGEDGRHRAAGAASDPQKLWLFDDELDSAL
jgi:hypothetical protein